MIAGSPIQHRGSCAAEDAGETALEIPEFKAVGIRSGAERAGLDNNSGQRDCAD